MLNSIRKDLEYIRDHPTDDEAVFSIYNMYFEPYIDKTLSDKLDLVELKIWCCSRIQFWAIHSPSPDMQSVDGVLRDIKFLRCMIDAVSLSSDIDGFLQCLR